jgi:hypothetical protein
MSEPPVAVADLERMYAALAAALDAVGRERETVFLAKLALTMAAALGDPRRVDEAIAIARAEIDSAPPR